MNASIYPKKTFTMSEPASPETRTNSSSPSLLSPVGNALSVAIDDDDDDDLLDVSPVPQEGSYRDNVDVDSAWQYYDEDDDDDGPPRFRLDSGLHTPLISHTREPARLNGLNYLNVLTYLLNVFVSYGIGVWGLGGILPTRWEISKEYVTLVTPAHWAYFLWAPILVFEAIFAIAQLFPYYRARPIIQQGTGFFFFYTLHSKLCGGRGSLVVLGVSLGQSTIFASTREKISSGILVVQVSFLLALWMVDSLQCGAILHDLSRFHVRCWSATWGRCRSPRRHASGCYFLLDGPTIGPRLCHSSRHYLVLCKYS
jgi:hypothetical protein